MDKTMKPAFDSADCKVLGDFVEKPTFHMGHTLLRYRLQRRKFPWTSWKSEAPTQVNKVWNKLVFTTLFEEGGDFLSRLEEAGVAKAIRTSASNSRYRHDMSLLWQRWCSQTYTFVTSWGEFSPTLEDVAMLLQLPVFGNLDLTNLYVDLDLRKLARDLLQLDSKKKKCTIKYSYSNWSRYFFGNFLNGEFVPASDDIPVDLKEAAFIAYWLSKYVFLGPADECLSQGVFLLACVIAQGRCVPLAPLYLGSLYARLDHFSEQLKIAHGRFPVLAYIDEIFLQLFLFEHFLRFTLLASFSRSYTSVWRKSLTWRRISASAPIQVLRMYLIFINFILLTLRMIVTGLSLAKIVSRQLGWDQDPKNVEPVFYLVEDLMKKVLFRSVLPEYDPDLVVPFDRIGGITMEYVEYLKCVKKYIRQYEGQFAAEIKSFTSILVKDPYFMTGNLSPTTIASNVSLFVS
ncbi:hypothetical protein PIB30_020613 [Stylosanthes scabra]|uniref:Aminotransferase-like plant mobile domain-containing protein n=1 Tax=Stylosanthes scabra TaxID=79078 RepID=A0ABU6S983_9FABA|nr:hypothetical protein [Stylosanthes scabra]